MNNEATALKTRGRKATPFVDGYRVCPGCGENKHRDDYYNNEKNPTGKLSRCKVCVDAVNAEWRKKNHETYVQAQKKWRTANEGHTYTTPGSYTKYIGYTHPAANASGITPYHRIVLWDKLSGQDAPCHVCGEMVYWGLPAGHPEALVGDHLDWDIENNSPENIEPAHHRCNVSPARRNPAKAKNSGPCSVEGCERDAATKGMCRTHYSQQWRGVPFTDLTGARMTDAQKQAILDDLQAGVTLVQVREKYGFDIGSVSRMFEREVGMSLRAWKKANKAGGAK